MCIVRDEHSRFFGDGKITAFGSDGDFHGLLRDATTKKPLAIDGLWTITLGGGRNSNSDTLYFTAGPNHGAGGLFGYLSPVSTELTEGNAQ